jgi:dihydrofolate reductase
MENNEPMLVLIAAMDLNRVIANGKKIPWEGQFPGDVNNYLEIVPGEYVISGRNVLETDYPPTYEKSKGRYFVLTNNRGYKAPEGVFVRHSLEDAIKDAKEMATKEGREKVYVIGGAAIYDEAINHADKLELTEINTTYEGDRFFPEINKDEWDEISRRPSEDGRYAFVDYIRKKRLEEAA